MELITENLNKTDFNYIRYWNDDMDDTIKSGDIVFYTECEKVHV